MIAQQYTNAAGTQVVENASQANANFIAILKEIMGCVATPKRDGVRLALELGCAARTHVLSKLFRDALHINAM